MKYKLSKFLGSVIAVCCLLLGLQTAPATGSVGADPVQTGTLTFNVSTGFYQTNSFPFSYTTPPIVQFYALTTNAVPITNIFVTTTNFAVSVNATNPAAQIAWTAQVGYPRLQSGTNAIQGALLVTNVFSTPFAFNPVVTISGSSTNALSGGQPCISSVSPTNFVIQFGNTNQVIYWHALGITATPGSYNPNYPSVTY
jgi:hypothetical protein